MPTLSSVDRADLAFSPLTIFAGANSSGKSTLLQSILLMSQTLASRVSSQTILLNGHLIKLGQFDDLKTAGSHKETIDIGWEIGVTPSQADEASLLRRGVKLKTVACDVSFGVSSTSTSRTLQLNPHLLKSELTCLAVSLGGGEDPLRRSVNIAPKITSVIDTIAERRRADQGASNVNWSFDYDVAFDPTSMQEIRDEISLPKIVGCGIQHFLPQWLIANFSAKDEIVKVLVTALLDPVRARLSNRYLNMAEIVIPNEIVQFIEEHNPEIREKIRWGDSDQNENGMPLTRIIQGLRMTSVRREKAGQSQDDLKALARKYLPDKEDLTTMELPLVFRAASEYLNAFFARHVRYLGPLREEPRALYPLQNTADPQDVGLHGEHTAAVFHTFRYSEVSYVPASVFNNSPSTSVQPVSASLGDAVTDWLEYLDIAIAVDTSDEGKFGHALKVGLTSHLKHDLTHVGVGVSQVLPIVVMCLLAAPGTTLILEQPELHLNPKVQTRLGDFFLSMALLSKQCLIETHSEYLINRLRFRIAADTTDSLSSLMTLYFVEKQQDMTHYRNVVINEYGAILEWPAGFFDQSQREVEEILLAATRKAKSR